MPTAISVILDEHRSIAAVLNGLLYLIDEIRAGRMKPDFRIFAAMLHYIEVFPEKLHHPKEDDYLFRLLRERDPAAAAILDELEGEHERGRKLIERLGGSVQRYQLEGPSAFEAFARDVADYARFHWSHMRKEEDVVLPMARKALSAEDWAEIDRAFRSNEDPIAGIADRHEHRELFRRIVNIAPPPIGLGPSSPAT